MNLAAEDILEIEDGTIDVVNIMARINQRVADRRASGIYDESELEFIMREVPQEGADQSISDPLHELNFVVRLASLRSQVSSEYAIGSGRKVIGPIIVFVKRLIRKLLRTYVDAVFNQQNEFNAYMVQSLQLLEDTLLGQRERLGSETDRALSYRLLGEDEAVTESLLAPVVELFKGQDAVLDLFSGRGDFLLAAKAHGIEASGVESDEELVRLCQERDLKVLQADPFLMLGAAPEDSLPAVFSADLGERMEAGELTWMTSVLGFAMKRGGLLAIFNHNPADPEGRAALLRDLATRRLVYPETLRYLLEAAGFSQMRVISLGSRYLLTARRS